MGNPKKEKLNVSDLRNGIGVIANVMLLGRCTHDGFYEKESNGELMDSLLQMTEAYSKQLLEKSERLDIEVENDKKNLKYLSTVVSEENKGIGFQKAVGLS